MQRRVAICGHVIDMRALLDQLFEHLEMARRSRNKKRRLALAVLCIQVGACHLDYVLD